jgi:hypothetical protein
VGDVLIGAVEVDHHAIEIVLVERCGLVGTIHGGENADARIVDGHGGLGKKPEREQGEEEGSHGLSFRRFLGTAPGLEEGGGIGGVELGIAALAADAGFQRAARSLPEQEGVWIGVDADTEVVLPILGAVHHASAEDDIGGPALDAYGGWRHSGKYIGIGGR